MLREAAKKVAACALANVQLLNCDAQTLPFAAGEFDSVVSSFTLPHFGDAETAHVLEEMNRVLRPNGRLGLFLGQGEMAPMFARRQELLESLRDAGFTDVLMDDRDDVFRIVLAKKPCETATAQNGTN